MVALARAPRLRTSPVGLVLLRFALSPRHARSLCSLARNGARGMLLRARRFDLHPCGRVPASFRFVASDLHLYGWSRTRALSPTSRLANHPLAPVRTRFAFSFGSSSPSSRSRARRPLVRLLVLLLIVYLLPSPCRRSRRLVKISFGENPSRPAWGGASLLCGFPRWSAFVLLWVSRVCGLPECSTSRFWRRSRHCQFPPLTRDARSRMASEATVFIPNTARSRVFVAPDQEYITLSFPSSYLPTRAPRCHREATESEGADSQTGSSGWE